MINSCFLPLLSITSLLCALLCTSFSPADLTTTVFLKDQQRNAAHSTTAAWGPSVALHRRNTRIVRSSRECSPSPTHEHGRRREWPRTAEMKHAAAAAEEVSPSSGVGDRQDFLKRVAAGALAGGLSSLAVLGSRPEEAAAFCGEPYPYWAYFVDFDEVFVPFAFEGYSGKVFARTVGSTKEEKKAKHNSLVVIPGGPGLPHDYLETLEGASKGDRVVLLFDPIGTGNSSALPADVRATAPDLLGTRCLVAQTNAVLDYFKFDTYHLLGHGTGAAAALEIGKSLGKPSPRPPGPELEAVLSVTLASPVLGESGLPPDFLESLRAPYTRGGNEAPLCLETAMQGQNADSFTGGVALMKNDRKLRGAVEPLACPVLITYGGRDVIGDKVIADLKEGLSGGDAPVEVKRFEESGHLAHLDERENYVTLVQNYITFVDEAWAGTSGETKK